MSTERITNETLKARVHNVNRRLMYTDTILLTEGRNGHTALDEGRKSDGAIIRTVTCGTKREIADFLHAMMVGIDLYNKEPHSPPA